MARIVPATDKRYSINKIAVSKSLVIVESPAKAKTIEGYLGKDFRVLSSFGHVRDLPKKNNAIDVANGFTPTYEVSKDKKEVISRLKKAVKEVDTVYLASDDDREGEAISWHLKEVLKLKDEQIRRIVFHEITKKAILKAIEAPRAIDIDLVNAQQARRVLDRLVGFELSPILWKKIKTGLSAGRVQSVAVRLIVEREREIEHFATKSFFKVTALFDVGNGKILKAELAKKLPSKEEAQAFLERCVGAEFHIGDLEAKEGKRRPSAPFTTSTLQQEASRKLGYSVSQTMLLAQRLYEAGHITYMRTDSVNLSQDAIAAMEAIITKEYGKEYASPKNFSTKSASAQEAHEAIRPTHAEKPKAGADPKEQRLYDMIWKRTLASQMAEAIIEKTTATITISTTEETLVATGEVVKFDGFLKLYMESTEDDEEEDAKGMLPPLTVGQLLVLQTMTAREGFTKHAPRYTEASLVKKLEEMGIGRPSTYAPTISTVQKRGYVEKEAREGKERAYVELTLQHDAITAKEGTEIYGAEKNKLYPTDLAKVVTDFLVEYFPDIVNYSFTADVEKEFDEIAQGQKIWNQMIQEFYKGFHDQVEKTGGIDRKELNTSRVLGTDPKTGKPVTARIGRFGPLVQIGDAEDEEKPKFAGLDREQSIETITLEEALKLFQFPKMVGTYEGEEMTVAKGRFGPYIKHKEAFYSLPKEDNPSTVTEARAVEIIEAKRQADREKFIKSFDEDPTVQVLNGRYGAYIKAGKQNVRIPKEFKETDPKTLTYAQVKEWIDVATPAPAKAPAKPAAKKPAKKAPAKKASAKKPARAKAKGK